MARKNNKSGKKAKKAKPEPQEEVLEEVDTGGMGIDEGILFTTFAMLAGAVFMVWTLLNERYPPELMP